MLSHIPLLVILTILTYSQSEDCVLWETITRQNAWDKVLHKEKMLHYGPREPPRNQSCVPVKVRLRFKSFDIDEYEGKFIAKVMSRLVWKDERLTWSPDNYGGVNEIIVDNSYIWVPSLKLMNSVDPDFYSIEQMECRIKHDGEIFCISQSVYESFCSANLSDWPYDVQNCTLQFGNGDKYDATKFSFSKQSMSVLSLLPGEYNNGWDLLTVDTKEDPNSNIQLSINLTMQRQAYGLVIILVVPCFVVCVLTSVSLLLNVFNSARLGLLCFSLLCHFAFLTAIGEFLPKHSADSPVILFFLRSSIIMTVTSVLLTNILSKIVTRKTVPFEWVSTISSKVFNSFAQYFIIPRWNFSTQIDDINLKYKEIWNNFANILNSVYIVIIVIVYINLFRSYTPKIVY